MRTSLTTTLSTVAAAALAVTVLTGTPAAADADTILRGGFRGNVPLTEPGATPVVGGVNPAGRGWILDERSRVRVRQDGRLTVLVRGLIFSNGDPNVVPLVAASLVCGGAVVDSTDPFELSVPQGNAFVSTRIDVPEGCADPVVLVRNASNPAGLGGYFAFSSATDG